ncbi:MAG: ATP synthase subunit I [Actinomycetota bacterium]|nr:ATP synthase subunit I [Actinomycetota bacterium]|tara:strand:+ start:257 stop:742 length:486 start_codon:yes stop_codon:yes gene_type:complete
MKQNLGERFIDTPENARGNTEPERGIVADMLRRGVKFVPMWLLFTLLLWGPDGAASAAYGIGLIFANFIAAAALLTWAGRISPTALMVAALGGFILRLGVLTVAVIAASKISVFAPVPLGITIIVSHLGLLIWETRYVSLSLAYPGIGPRPLGKKNYKEMK